MTAPKIGESGLHELINQAHDHYQVKVVNEGWIYERFIDDFISGIRHSDAIDAKSLNDHEKNVKTVEYLLHQRKDLVDGFFGNEKISLEDIIELLLLINTTHAVPENDVDSTVHSRYSLHPCLHADECKLLAECCNRVGIFQSPITTKAIISLLNGKMTTPLYSANNRLLAYMFNGLSKRNLIDNNWQSILTKQNIIYTSTDKGVIQKTTLSSALYNVTSIALKHRPSTFKDLEDILDEIKHMNDKKRSRFM